MTATNYKSSLPKPSSEIPTRPNQSALERIEKKVRPKVGPRNQLAAVAAGSAGEWWLDRRGELRKQRQLLLLLITLLMVFTALAGLLLQYIRLRVPLPEMLPGLAGRNIPPHYVFSMYGVDRPVSVAVSPVTERLYVGEMDGNRMIKMFPVAL